MQVESEGHTADDSTSINAHIRAKLGAAQGTAQVFLPAQTPSTGLYSHTTHVSECARVRCMGGGCWYLEAITEGCVHGEATKASYVSTAPTTHTAHAIVTVVSMSTTTPTLP